MRTIIHCASVEYRGSCFLLFGQSGAGKTTTANSIVRTVGFTLIHDDIGYIDKIDGKPVFSSIRKPLPVYPIVAAFGVVKSNEVSVKELKPLEQRIFLIRSLYEGFGKSHWTRQKKVEIFRSSVCYSDSFPVYELHLPLGGVVITAIKGVIDPLIDRH